MGKKFVEDEILEYTKKYCNYSYGNEYNNFISIGWIILPYN